MTSRVLKVTPVYFSYLLTHAINRSIQEKKFPQILKKTKIMPIIKKNKERTMSLSYRPIANLSMYEKIFEEHIKINLEKHMEKNNVILPNHHGGTDQHSLLR